MGWIIDFLFDIPAYVLITYAIFALLSYVLYAFIFVMLSALVSKIVRRYFSCKLCEGVLAAKIFRFGTLHYGNQIKIRTALKKFE